MLGIFIAILVAIIWALGDVNYSKISNKYDKANVYLYTYLLRAVIYIGVVFIFQRSIIGTFNKDILLSTLPIIMCDMFASLVINLAMTNGKLSIVSPIMASYPAVDVLLGTILLKEKISIIEIILVVIINISIIILAMNQKKSKKIPHPKIGIVFSILYMLLVSFSIYFEKTNYIHKITIYDLYYYKGSIYIIASTIFAIIIAFTSKKMSPLNKDIIKGCSLTPIGNVLDSIALSIGDISIITPISSLYAAITNFISRFYLKEKITIREKICIGLVILCTLTLIILKI